ncbi:MAG: hypothetical protein BroJett003_01790 [Planctomycetota bacterium]|nr:MAG: hypothetical protein BroJett003_01790 [Planctomycetota bacterium]
MALFNLIINVVGWYLILRYVAPRVVRFLAGNPEVAKGGASLLKRLFKWLMA